MLCKKQQPELDMKFYLRRSSIKILCLTLLVAANSLLAASMNDYVQEQMIGRGAYGEVFLCRLKDPQASQEYVAIKKIPLHTEQRINDGVVRELLVANLLKGEANLIQLKSHFIEDSSRPVRGRYLFIVLEYHAQSLDSYLQIKRPAIPFATFKNIARGLYKGIRRMHARGILHGDIKPANVVFAAGEEPAEANVTIIDFSLSQEILPRARQRGSLPLSKFLVNQPLSSYAFTDCYKPPEVLLGSTNYSESADFWSLGILLHQLCLGARYPFTRSDLNCKIGSLMAIFASVGTPYYDPTTEEGLHSSLTHLPFFQTTFPQWQPKLAADLNAHSLIQGSEQERSLAHLLVLDLLTADPVLREQRLADFPARHPWVFALEELESRESCPTSSSVLVEPEAISDYRLTVLVQWCLEIYSLTKGSSLTPLRPFCSFYPAIALASTAIAALKPTLPDLQAIFMASMIIMRSYFEDDTFDYSEGAYLCGRLYSPGEIAEKIEAILGSINAADRQPFRSKIYRLYIRVLHSNSQSPDCEITHIAHLLILLLANTQPLPLSDEGIYEAVMALSSAIVHGENSDKLVDPAQLVFKRIQVTFSFIERAKVSNPRPASYDSLCEKFSGQELAEKIRQFFLPF